MTGRIFVDDASTILVTTWHDPDGTFTVTVAHRDASWETWGPPVTCDEITEVLPEAPDE